MGSNEEACGAKAAFFRARTSGCWSEGFLKDPKRASVPSHKTHHILGICRQNQHPICQNFGRSGPPHPLSLLAEQVLGI